MTLGVVVAVALVAVVLAGGLGVGIINRVDRRREERERRATRAYYRGFHE